MQASKLHLHSYGIVAINKPRSTHEIEVNPIEETPSVDGELTDHATEDKSSGKDADGAAFEVATNTAVTLTARWLPFGSNRMTSPDVRRGEKVAIWRFGDADKYYWSSLEYEARLRKLETVVFAFSNTQVEDDDATAENTYFIEFSTHDKRIHLHTSQSDGEPYGYDILLNTKEGNFQIRDTIDNIFFLSSPDHQWKMINTDGSYVEVINEDVNIFAVRDFNVVAGNDITMLAGRDKLVDVGGKEVTSVEEGRTVQVGTTISYTAPSSIDFTTPTFTTSEVLKTGSTAFIGGALSTGNTPGMGGNSTIRGSLSLDGEISSSSGATFSGTVRASNIN